MHVDEQDVVTAFVEKPKKPPHIPGSPGMALASMGIYVFRTALLIEELRRDADDPDSKRDFGGDIIPHIVKHGKAVDHRFSSSCEIGRASCRESVCHDVSISVVAVSLKKKKQYKKQNTQ